MKISDNSYNYSYLNNTNTKSAAAFSVEASLNKNLDSSSTQPNLVKSDYPIRIPTSLGQSIKYSESNPPKNLDEVLEYFLEIGKQWCGNYNEIVFNSCGKSLMELFQESFAIQESRKQKEINTLNNDITSKVGKIKTANAAPVSIFDTEEIAQETRNFLADKPMTAVRYQRLYEQDPAKAELFIANIMTNGDHTTYDMDEKYQGWEYTDVLNHVNALLILNYNDVCEENYQYSNQLQTVFSIDDGIGEKYSSIRKSQESGFMRVYGEYDCIPLGTDTWMSGMAHHDLIPSLSVDENLEYKELEKNNMIKINLHKPIGISQKNDFSIYIEKNKVFSVDKENLTADPAKHSYTSVKSTFYSMLY